MNEQQTPHWEARLSRGFAPGKQSEATVQVDPTLDRAGMVLVAARIEGIYAALAPRADEGEPDPLTGEDTEDLLRLLDHLHRVIAALTAQEDRVIDVLRQRDVSARRTASAMQVYHRTVLNRYRRIDAGAERGQNSLAYSEDQTAELSDD